MMTKFKLTIGVALTMLLVCALTGCPSTMGRGEKSPGSGNSGKGPSMREGGGGSPYVPPAEYVVTFSVDGTGGSLKATVDGGQIKTGDKVQTGKTVTFEAIPTDAWFEVSSWSVPGGTFVTGGKKGDDKSTLTVGSANVTVTVKFSSRAGSSGNYVKVPYDKLEDYFKNSDSETVYIEVTDLEAKHLSLENGSGTGPLGEKLKAASGTKVDLKLPDNITGLTSMFACFSQCKNLISLQNIPQGVTKMNNCFYSCTNLAQAPVIPQSVTEMSACFYNCTSLKTVTLKCKYNGSIISVLSAFEGAFAGCTALEDGGIKVPADQLDAYKNNAGKMNTDVGKFSVDTP